MNLFISRRNPLKVSILALLMVVFCATAAFGQQGATMHKVKKGETLYRIAATYGLTVEDIEQANPQLAGKVLKKGTRIVIPSPVAKRAKEEQARKDSLAAITANGQKHLVKTGETLWGLSQQYGVSVDDIKRANPQMAPSFNLLAGSTIVIRPAKNAILPKGIDHIKIAVMLPLNAKGIAADRSMEFYRGLLMAANELKGEGKKMTIYAYDEPAKADSIVHQIDKILADSVHFLIGPIQPAHLNAAAEALQGSGIKMLVPFISTFDKVRTYPNVYMLNAPEQQKCQLAATLLRDAFNGKLKVILAEAALSNASSPAGATTTKPKPDKQAEFAQILFKTLAKMGVPTAKTSETFTPEMLAAQAQGNYQLLVLPAFSGKEQLDSLAITMTAFHAAHPEICASLLGHPDWLDEGLDTPTTNLLSSADTYVFATSFYNPGDTQTAQFERMYWGWFKQDLLKTTPRMGLLGYDCGKVLIHGLSIYGADFTTQELQMPFLQSDITFQRIGAAGGYANQSSYLIHFSPNGIEKISPRK